MMKKAYLMLCSFICMASSLHATASPRFEGTLPAEFSVKERAFSWISTFDLETKQFKLGYVQRKLLSLQLEYDFYDFNDELHAKAKKRFFSWGAAFDVVDAHDAPIGQIEQRLFSFFPSFCITSPKGE